MEEFKNYEKQRFKKYYDEKLGIKVCCPICNREVTAGRLTNHQKTKLCKPIGSNTIVRENTEKDLERREWHKEYAKQWRERKKTQNQPNSEI